MRDGGNIHAQKLSNIAYAKLCIIQHVQNPNPCAVSKHLEQICQRKEGFGERERAQKEMAAREILEHAIQIVESEDTFSKKLLGEWR